MPVSRPPRQADRNIQTDTPCRRCGYNLRSLAESGKCPECATPIALSIRGDLLQHADPNWVATLARGATLVVYAIGTAIVAFILTLVAALAGFPIDWLLITVWVLAGLTVLVAQWLLTRPDPSAPADEGLWTGRRILRILLCVALAIVGLEQIVPLLGPLASHPKLVIAAGIVTAAAVLCWAVAYFRYLASLCDRIPDAKRAMMCRRVGLILIVLGIVVTLMGFIPGVGPRGAGARSQSRLTMFVDLVFAFLNLALLLYATRALGLNFAIAERLRAEAKQAAANWLPTPPDVSQVR